jgi:glutamate racemase
MGPIGVFDSGYGGLTILSELRKELPEYDFLYFGDNARAPYGTRSFDIIYEYTLQAVNELFDRGCHLIILACNTASAKALRTIQQKDLVNFESGNRVLGVIRPSTEVIGELTTSNNVGILATQGTVESESYKIEIEKFFPEINVFQHACPLWVPLIENNKHTSKEGKALIKTDVELLLEKNREIDTIVLACTHYPMVVDFIKTIVPSDVKIIEQGPLVSKSLSQYLTRNDHLANLCTKNGEVRFLTSETPINFNRVASNFLGYSVESKQVDL